MEQLIKHPQATFMLRVRGDSMKDAGIMHGSVVRVDKATRSLYRYAMGVLNASVLNNLSLAPFARGTSVWADN